MKKLTGLLSLFVILLGPVGTAPAKELLFSDAVLFRLQNRTVFLTDLIPYQNHLKTFRCLYTRSELLALSGLNMESFGALELKKASELTDANLLEQVKMNLKIQIYNNTQPLSVAAGFENELPLTQCGVKDYSSWPDELKSLVQAELVLRSAELKTQKDRTHYLDKVKKVIEDEQML